MYMYLLSATEKREERRGTAEGEILVHTCTCMVKMFHNYNPVFGTENSCQQFLFMYAVFVFHTTMNNRLSDGYTSERSYVII